MDGLRLSIFFPKNTPFYQSLYQQFVLGLEVQGFITAGCCELLDEEKLIKWCKVHQPDVILEMNRSRCEIPFLPKNIKHINWLIDLQGRELNHFQGSDITYLFTAIWNKLFPYSTKHRWLGPGANEFMFTDSPGKHRDNVAFVGHIPKPWSPEELQREVSQKANTLNFANFLPMLEEELSKAQNDSESKSFTDIAEKIIFKTTNTQLRKNDPNLLYDISCRTIRVINRQHLIGTVLKYTHDLSIYGPDHWQKWSQFKIYYKHYLNSQEDLKQVYNRSKIQLHEGEGIHFRSMDCMAAHGLIFYHSSIYDDLPGGINTFFEPYIHYVPFTSENFNEQYEKYTSDDKAANQIRSYAAQQTKQEHRWIHRAKIISQDIKEIL